MLVALLSAFIGFLHVKAFAVEDSTAFLEENKQRDGVVVLPSGLQYRVLQIGQGTVRPNATTKCFCHYRGSLIDGSVFDSSYDRGQPTSFTPSQVIPGWSEALQMMVEGDRWELVVPPELGYGNRAMGKKIPANSVLVFEIQLISIVPDTPFNSFLGALKGIFGNGPPVWMIMALYFSYIMLFKVAPWVKSQFFPEKVIPRVSLTDAAGKKENVKVYLDVRVGDGEPGRIEIELFNSVVPKTAENFRILCTGEKGKGQSGKPLHFKDSTFHRIINGFMAQGGDITRADGTGGESIYGTTFEDEFDNGLVEHSVPFLLSMANAGKDSNGSGCFITFDKTSWLDGKHVVFGRVCAGQATVKAMEACGSSSGKPSKPVVIVDCGQIRSKSD